MNWIKCEDKMPEIGHVVYLTDNRHIVRGSLRKTEKIYFWYLEEPRNFERIVPIFSEWCEIPELPEIKK